MRERTYLGQPNETIIIGDKPVAMEPYPTILEPAIGPRVRTPGEIQALLDIILAAGIPKLGESRNRDRIRTHTYFSH